MKRSTTLSAFSALALLLAGGIYLATEAPTPSDTDAQALTDLGLEAQPVSDQCKSTPCPSGCIESGIQAPYDLGVTGCRDPIQGIISCSGGETVHAHSGACLGSGCEGFIYVEGPYYCD